MNDATGASAPEELPPLLTEEDHERGWVDWPLVFRSGKKQTVRLTAPDFLSARSTALKFSQSVAEMDLIGPCLPQGFALDLNKLAPDSVAGLSNVCYALTFGEDQLKKSRAAVNLLVRTISAAKPPGSSAPDSPGAKSENGASPS